MDSKIEKFIEDALHISYEAEYHFRRLCGFTFVFRTEAMFFKDSITSFEIAPVGIIYEENGEYYLAPLSVIEDIEGVVEEFVKNCKVK